MLDIIEKNNLCYRFERKFVISGMNSREVESIVNLHPAMFTGIFQKRFVNNIYLDSLELNSYHDNINGNARRKKTRFRWYGELFLNIEKPVIEIKIKNGLLGKKLRYSLEPFEVDKHFSIGAVDSVIKKSQIPQFVKTELKSLKPTLLNRYNRQYFLSADKRFRITIDTDQLFYQIGQRNNLFAKKIIDTTHTILELKYDMDSDDDAKQITNHFPFRLTKSSKYVTGIERIYE